MRGSFEAPARAVVSARLVQAAASEAIGRGLRRALRPLAGQRVAGHEIKDGLGDVGGVVADPLEVLGAEQQMRAEGDVARILHHVGQQIAEHRILERVEFDVALPDRAGALDVALGVGVEHVLQQFGGDVVHMLEADDLRAAARLAADLERTLGDVLGEIADAFEIAGDADRADDLAQIDRHRLAARRW